MKQYHNVQSAKQPEEIRIDEFSVWVSGNVRKTNGGFEYDLTQYGKDEYLGKMQADVEYIAMMTEVELE